jgi:F0F1-type ATP synthase assembly protein I
MGPDAGALARACVVLTLPVSLRILQPADEQRRYRMDDAGVGWIAAIIIGGLAGWIASRFMNSDTGVFMNIILGIIGAAVASFISLRGSSVPAS